jgi:SAM-dependent methyltransferase
VKKKEWFAAWFDSAYYHTLYKNHDEQEARLAVDGLLRTLDLKPGARVLDLACGKGRHSRYLAEKGFDVTGLDISHASISHARQFEHERLSFFQHDMRKPFRSNYFDAVLNMFTSFGYFKTDADHLRSLQNVRQGLRPGGLLLLDYFNAQWVRQHLVRQDEKVVDGIRFYLKKNIRGPYVYKTVAFEAEGRKHVFRERVRLFEHADFQKLMTTAGLQITQAFGGYDGTAFDPGSSKRLILLAQKPPRP